MIRQNYLPTVQPSSVQKKENKENQYQMQRGPLSSATHTKTTTTTTLTTTTSKAYKQNNQTKQKHEKTSRSETGRKKANKTRLMHGSCSFIYPQSIKIVNQLKLSIKRRSYLIQQRYPVWLTSSPCVVTIFIAVVGPGGFALLGTG